VLVIGVGGGIDVMIALAHDAVSVTAVEINRAMIDMVADHFDVYLGGLFHRGAHPLAHRIDLVHGEGRAFVRQSPERYDVIQLSGVDSFTALNTGAYTLSESYLYTTEAIRDFYEHLADEGYINFSRFIMKPPKKPRDTLRLAHVAYVALQEMGIDDPASHIAVFQGFDWASTLIKRGRFTRAELDALEAFARLEGFLGLVFDPLEEPEGVWCLAQSASASAREKPSSSPWSVTQRSWVCRTRRRLPHPWSGHLIRDWPGWTRSRAGRSRRWPGAATARARSWPVSIAG
jgi:hypothetical protein